MKYVLEKYQAESERRVIDDILIHLRAGRSNLYWSKLNM